MEHLGRLIITYTMVIKDRWQMQMVKMTPRERFLHFVTKTRNCCKEYLKNFWHLTSISNRKHSAVLNICCVSSKYSS